jgi:2-polyprenyl-6-methoxyphenol hydroxylase-like FAD-dependent oxidoreductase
MGSWRAGCAATRTSGSAARAGETDRPKRRHRAPARPIHLVVLAGRPQVARGDRLATYLAGIRRFPATLNPRLLDRAELASRLLVAPEPALRGYFCQASGPGWALVGDAGHFKHPATGRGIGDAVEQAWFVADALLRADPELATYQRWRDGRAAEHYEWSYRAAHWPVPERVKPLFAGLTADPLASQEWRDLFTRRTRPSEVYTAERLAAWTGRRRQPEGARNG